MRFKIKYSLAVLLLIAGSLGCAAEKQKQPLFWPAAPEEPRIAHVKSMHRVSDFRKPNFWDSFFGAGTEGIFSKPYGVYAGSGTLYVTDSIGGFVMVFNMNEQKVRFITGDDENLGRPMGVAVAPDGTIFISDAKRGKVIGFNEKGKAIAVIGEKELRLPVGLAINGEKGRLYVVDATLHKVFAYSLMGELLFSIGEEGFEDAQFHGPTNVAIDRRNGTLYVIDTLNCRVQAFDPDGKFLRKFGELGDMPGTFTRPKGIGVDTEGHVYVADAAFDNFQIFSENGEILMHIGHAGMGPGTFSLPAGLTVDEQDRIYVADQVNKRVEVYQYFSAKWKEEHPEEYRKMLAPPDTTSTAK